MKLKLLLFFILSFNLFAAPAPHKITKDVVEIGNSDSSEFKVLSFDIGDATGNPSLSADATNGDFTLNRKLTLLSSEFDSGDGTDVDWTMLVDLGLGGSNPALRYNTISDTWQFNNGGGYLDMGTGGGGGGSTSFLTLDDVDETTFLGAEGDCAKVDASGSAIVFNPCSDNTLLGLDDIETTTFAGQAGKILTVNDDGTGMGLTALSSGGFGLDGCRYEHDGNAEFALSAGAWKDIKPTSDGTSECGDNNVTVTENFYFEVDTTGTYFVMARLCITNTNHWAFALRISGESTGPNTLARVVGRSDQAQDETASCPVIMQSVTLTTGVDYNFSVFAETAGYVSDTYVPTSDNGANQIMNVLIKPLF